MRYIKSARSAESCAFLVSFLSCLRATSQKIVYVIRFFRQNARRAVRGEIENSFVSEFKSLIGERKSVHRGGYF